jgi:hypothetical protein
MSDQFGDCSPNYVQYQGTVPLGMCGGQSP